MKAKAFVFLSLILTATAGSADVVFEEDFESVEKFRQRWQAPAGWSLVKSERNGRKNTVLDIKGGKGEEGLSVRGGLDDFDYEADFRVVAKGAGFVFRAQDADNLYMLWLRADDDSFYPHTKKKGAYPFAKLPLSHRIPLGQWLHVKFEIRGNEFKCFLGKSAERMELAGKWKGAEPYRGGRFGFRCWGNEQMQVDNIRISTSGPVPPELAVERPSLPRMITAGRSFDVKLNVRSIGWKTAKNVRATLSLPKGLGLAEGKQTQSCGNLESGAGRRVFWKVKPTKAAAGRIEIAVTCDGLPAAKTIPVDFVVNSPLPTVSGKPAREAAARIDANGSVILKNQNLRIVFVKNPKGYTAAIVAVYEGKQWRQVAVSQPIGHVAYRTRGGRSAERDILPKSCQVLDAGGSLAQVRFTEEYTDKDGCRWNFAFTFEIESGRNTVRTHYQAWASRNRQLLYFQGPDLYAGDGSFGARKHLALFPGLEYLEAHEKSSSERDSNQPYANRYAPHPYRITIPLMAVETDGCLVGLMWDMLQKWDSEHFAPSARFASPNFKDKQDNHLMGLFLPSIPKFVPENGDRATKAYPLKANKKITLEAHIVARASAKVLDMLDHYMAVYGMPEKIALPITYDEALELGRVGYMKTVYDAKAQGIKLWELSPAYPAPGACAILWRLSLDVKDPARKKMIRDRVDLMVSRALKREGMKGLTDWLDGRDIPFSKKFPAACGVRSHLLPFYIGRLEGGLAAWKKRVYEELIDKQRADGSWEYLGDMRKMVRQGDGIVNGTIVELTGGVLKYARITGDRRALASGMKAIKYMERFIVPRGMNTWEVAKYTPDIQAAGLAVWCYLEAYQITGEEKYLDKAKYWAKTGVPFVYFWEAPDRPVMKYGTIAVYGTSWRRHTWFGRPVQWCGLPYGYWILKLAEYDRSFPWRAIGEGILDSGIEQMLMVRDKKPGLYADALQLVGKIATQGPAWEPELIMKSIFLMRGQGVEVDTKVLHQDPKRVHVSTGAILKAAKLARTGRRVSFELEYPAGETSYAVIAGLGPGVEVKKDGRVLARTGDLESANEGWKASADGLLLLKLKHVKRLVKLSVTEKGKPRRP
jgi:hypothetical protein